MFTSSSYGEGLETGCDQAPRQSLTRQLFFKALKQNLRIKTFVGTSALMPCRFRSGAL